MNGYKSKRNSDQQVIYAFAHVESWLESYAKSTGQPASELIDGRKGREWTPVMRRAASVRMKKAQAKLQAARRAALAA